MKKLTITIFCLVAMGLLWYLFGSTIFGQKQAEKVAKNYYSALVSEDYEQAFEYLYVYDEHFDAGTNLSRAEAKSVYMKNMNQLKERGYKVKKFEINQIRLEDGVLMLINSTVTVEYNKETKSTIETLQYNNPIGIKPKVFVDYSEDEFAQYRGGKLNMLP